MTTDYIHGRTATERGRLALMNSLINDACLEALALGTERLVLDVGCGTGQFTRLMAASLASDARIVAIERDPGQLEAARSAGDPPAPGCTVEFREGDAMRLELPAGECGAFDCAHSRFLLEHVPDPEAVVRRMVEAVRPGGRVVLLDDDHDLLRLWPEPPGVVEAWRAYWRSYYRLGTDPLVGRRLCTLLHEAGARPTRNNQLFYGACAGSSHFPGIVDNLIGVLAGARDTVLDTGEIRAAAYDAALDSFRRFRDRPDAAVWYLINWAEGVRPA